MSDLPGHPSPTVAVGVPPEDGALPLILVLNPSAGKGHAGRELVHLRTHLHERGVKADVFLTQAPGDGKDIIDELDPPPGSVVIAAGGDGTVHEVGSALIGRPQVSLGVIPMGSGNDFAGLMQMPARAIDSLDTIIGGVDAMWDVGQVGPQPFLNTVGFGFSSSVTHYSHDTGSLRGYSRYGVAIARALRRFRPTTIGIDGLQASGNHRITLMEVGIGDRCGGGFRLTHLADPTDGLLDVCIVASMPRWKIPMLLPRGVSGKHIGHPLVTYEQVPSFRLSLDSDVMIHVDGEIRRLGRGEHTIKVVPKALRVRLPAGHPLAQSPAGAVQA